MMKSHIWIFLVISISTFIAATSNNTSSVAENLLLSSTSSSTSSASSSKITAATAKTFMLMSKKSSNMSLPLMITSPQTTILYSSQSSTTTNAESTTLYYENFPRKLQKQNLHSRNPLMSYDGSSKKRRSPAEASNADCEQFESDNDRVFTSPGWPDNYTKNMNCVKVITAPMGYQIKLDFRDKFRMEPSEDCKFDYLEIRDGQHAFSKELGKYCGHNFPDSIDSSGRYLWLNFHSDDNIEQEGFKAVYEYVPRPSSGIYDDMECNYTVEWGEHKPFHGKLRTEHINKEKIEYIKKHKLHLDCMAEIEVKQGWKIQINFTEFKLGKPNDCTANYIDIFNETTDTSTMLHRQRQFCGSIADLLTVPSDKVHIRYYAEADSLEKSDSKVEISFTAFRPKGKKSDGGEENCAEDEFDCEDSSCIMGGLKCNDEVNCRFKFDEDETNCKTEKENGEQMLIILSVFGVMLSIMIIAFIFNCVRKIMRDHKIIREHIRQSRESKLDEIERHSTKMTKSRENIALQQLTKIPPPSFDLDSMTPINISSTADNQFYHREEKEHSASNHDDVRKSQSRNDLNMREQEIKHIFGSSYHDSDEYKDNSEMCDTACQTRESLFQPVFNRNKITQSPCPSGMRFSTFGHLDSSSTPSPPLPPSSSIVTHCPSHSMKQLSMPHQHSHHHHYHHLHSSTNPSISADEIDNSMGTIGTINSKEKGKKLLMKKDEAMALSRSVAGESRKSAPDVIIIAGCNTSH